MAAWVSETADRGLAAVEEHRSTWQMWHVRAEAQRQVRATDIPANRPDGLVDLLVDEVLHTRSVPLARTREWPEVVTLKLAQQVEDDLDAVSERLDAALHKLMRPGGSDKTAQPSFSRREQALTRTSVAAPPAGFEPATQGLGNLCSIP